MIRFEPIPYPLGRHPDAGTFHDPRSRGFAAAVVGPVVTKSWRRYGLVLNQGTISSCTGNALIHARNSAPNHIPGTVVYREPRAVDVYTLATQIDPYPGSYPDQDTGSDGLSAAKAALRLGLISSYSHAFGIDHAVQALMSGPLIVGTDWYDSMFSPNAAGLVTIGGAIAGGHEYALTGYNASSRVFRFQNSWGSTWGVGGSFYMTWATFDALLGAQGDAIQLAVA